MLLLAGCATTPSAPNDPAEPANRAVHQFNKGFDYVLFRPASKAYATVLPNPVQQGVSNVASNLDLPGDVINGALQGDINNMGKNLSRFLINTTLGVGGIFDPAKHFGLTQEKTDFGETLYVWGAGEGAYVELPFFGPSNVRDATGRVVDIVSNPVRAVLPEREGWYADGFEAGSKLGDRARYSDTIDQLLYESADSYAQARLLYQQNRRFELGQSGDEAGDDFIDPYEE